jgi:hypothetical protein
MGTGFLFLKGADHPPLPSTGLKEGKSRAVFLLIFRVYIVCSMAK